MDEFERLLKAAIEGNALEMERLAEDNPGVLCETTDEGNTCLHIASICGHRDFCSKVLKQKPSPSVMSSSLLSVTNKDGETPLLIAVKSGHVSLAFDLLDEYRKHDLNEDLLRQDKDGCNVLHLAIRNGNQDLALQLIDQQPALADSRNKWQESPMFIAVLRGFVKVYTALLDNEMSEYTGAAGYNALHAAVKFNNEDFVEKIFNKSPEKAKTLARQEDHKKDTPVQLTAHFNRDKILKIMLRCDRSLAYATSTFKGNPLLLSAAYWGHAAFARALLEYCPDAPYRNNEGRTCLHEAVYRDRIEFVQFILEKNSKLRKLVNMQDDLGETALHIAVEYSNPKMVSALLDHPDIDITVINKHACAPVWSLCVCYKYAKTINWNKICWLILNVDSRAKTDIYNLHEEIRNRVNEESRKDAKSLIETYTGNTSVVAILIATITFAVAFTLPGGYSSDTGSEGLPILAKKPTFQAFLIFDTLGMCSSVAVAFTCLIARWIDFEFLLHYRFVTKRLMWFSYMATTLAFATGLYTVLASRLHWLAIAICILSVLLPILTSLIGEWPILKLKFRYRNVHKPSNSNFLDMV